MRLKQQKFLFIHNLLFLKNNFNGFNRLANSAQCLEGSKQNDIMNVN